MTETTKSDIERVARAMMRTTDIGENSNVEVVSMDWRGSELWSCDFEEMAEAAIKAWNTRAPQWQPIETAPKDGTCILLAEPNPGGTEIPWLVIEGKWVDCPHTNARGKDFEPRFMAYYPAIYVGATSEDRSHCGKPVAWISATHWMPLPEAPEASVNDCDNCGHLKPTPKEEVCLTCKGFNNWATRSDKGDIDHG